MSLITIRGLNKAFLSGTVMQFMRISLPKEERYRITVSDGLDHRSDWERLVTEAIQRVAQSSRFPDFDQDLNVTIEFDHSLLIMVVIIPALNCDVTPERKLALCLELEDHLAGFVRDNYSILFKADIDGKVTHAVHSRSLRQGTAEPDCE